MKQDIHLTIFPVYYKPFMVYPVPYLHPVQAGHNLYEDFGIEGDDRGDNISALNQNFVELSAAYYIWKNYKKEEIPYWGLCHYRRYFTLHLSKFSFKRVYYLEANEGSFEKIFTPQLEEALKMKLSEGYVILPKPYHIYKLKKWSVKQHYGKYHRIEDWNLMEGAIQKLHPDYMDSLSEFGGGLDMFLYNMLIAPYDFWNSYLSWLFSILFEVQKHCIIPEDANQRRVFGFLAERLINVYVLHHRKKAGLKVHYMPVAHLG